MQYVNVIEDDLRERGLGTCSRTHCSDCLLTLALLVNASDIPIWVVDTRELALESDEVGT